MAASDPSMRSNTPPVRRLTRYGKGLHSVMAEQQVLVHRLLRPEHS
jgi:hypothetical protein